MLGFSDKTNRFSQKLSNLSGKIPSYQASCSSMLHPLNIEFFSDFLKN
jgi:hypothetical protein